jgi:hypothetical protein
MEASLHWELLVLLALLACRNLSKSLRPSGLPLLLPPQLPPEHIKGSHTGNAVHQLRHCVSRETCESSETLTKTHV